LRSINEVSRLSWTLVEGARLSTPEVPAAIIANAIAAGGDAKAAAHAGDIIARAA
jgi:hypothetical protein